MGIIRSPFSQSELSAGAVQNRAGAPTNMLSSTQFEQNQLANDIETRARAIANEMVAQMARQAQVASSGRVFTRFDVASDIIENQKTFVTTGLFTGNAATMSMAYSSSAQSAASKVYYYDMLSANPAVSTSEVQFALAHGH